MEEIKLVKLIEAILFVYGDPINEKKLSVLTGEKKKDVSSALANLEQRLRGSSGLRLIREGDSVQLVSSKEYGPLIEKIINSKRKEELTRASLEVLAIVGYSGPITRDEVEQIRGVNSTYIVRSLIMRGLIDTEEIEGREKLSLSLEAKKRLGLTKEEDLPDWLDVQEKLNKAKESFPNSINA